jgi:hypothetical protein
MSDNWDLALSNARGEYLTVIGDDDGLLLHALQTANGIIEQLNVNAVRWDKLYYHWPDQANFYPPGYLRVPLRSENRLLEADGIVAAVISGAAPYASLPMIYNSFIRVDIVAELRKRTGRVFKAITPDIYSGFACAALLESYASTSCALGIEGVSGRSNGAATFYADNKNDVATEFRDLNSAAGLHWNASVPMISRSISAVVAESFEQAKANLRLFKKQVVNRRSLATAILGDILRFQTPEQRIEALHTIETWLSDDRTLKNWFKSVAHKAEAGCGPTEHVTWNGRVRGFSNDHLEINTTDFGISNTYGVAEFYSKLCGDDLAALVWHSRPSGVRKLVIDSKNAARDITPPVVWRALQRIVARVSTIQSRSRAE